MGYFCYILLILFSGAAGGAIYSLPIRESHRVRLPFYRNKRGECIDLEAGICGHMFIGAGAGLLLVSLAISHLNFNVEPAVAQAAGLFLSKGLLGNDGLLVVIKTMATALVGGFLGLKLIVKIADQSLAQTNTKVAQLHDEVHELGNTTLLYQHLLSARTLMGQPDLAGALNEIEKSLAIKPTKHGELVKGMILRRRNDLGKAIEALNRALKLPPDIFSKDDSGVYWNKACYLKLINPENLPEIMESIDRSIEINPSFKADIATDEDLKDLLDKPQFKDHYQS